jgi:hypothetical protein
MRKKWEYGVVHMTGVKDKEHIPGSLWPDSHMPMDDVKGLLDTEAAGNNGSYSQDEWLRIAGNLGWELCCSAQDQSGLDQSVLLWYFKREL